MKVWPSSGDNWSAFAVRNWRLMFSLGTALGDIFAMTAAAVASHYHGQRVTAAFVSLYEVTFLLIGAAFGLYRSPYTAPAGQYVTRALKVAGLSAAVVMLVIWSRQAVAEELFWLFAAPTGIIGGRVAGVYARRRLQQCGYGIVATIVVVPPSWSKQQLLWIDSLYACGYEVKGTIAQSATSATLLIKEIERMCEKTSAKCVLLPDTDYVTGNCEALLMFAKDAGFTVRLFSPAIATILARAHVAEACGVTVQQPERWRITSWRRAVKRTFDIIAACFLLIVTMPVLAIAAAAIKWDSDGPVLYRQRRALAPGQPSILVNKLRTMVKDAHTQRRAVESLNQGSAALFKISRDPRITSVGRWLRRTSIDELPQLWNVLEGTMSLVGPRPLPEADVASLTGSDLESFSQRRSQAVPGITGMWQIAGRSHLGFREMMVLDLFYVENSTIFLDLAILAHTIPVAVTGRGAY